jgi:hypothetical protein|tara:strand:- start:33 stop:458 length:426 start_codon:yes stop_codon:yes gene_type:complete
MSFYHPPNNITNNQSPIYTADLAYEGHGKCGNTRILTNAKGEDSEVAQIIFDAATEGNGNAWRMDVISTGNKTTTSKDCPCTYAGGIRTFIANNISELDSSALVGVPIHQPFSIMADITYVQLDVSVPYLIVVLYMDCKQS